MIPYFPPVAVQIGAVQIQGFGVAAAASLLLGYYLVRRGARNSGLDTGRAALLFLGCVCAGLATGHAAAAGGGSVRFWRGQSTWGLIAGAAVTLVVFLAWNRKDAIRYLDVMALAFPWAWAVARFGCFLTHDHIGARSSHWLAVDFPGGSRFDLGALECLASLLVGLLVLLFRWRYPIRGVAALTLLGGATVARSAVRLAA